MLSPYTRRDAVHTLGGQHETQICVLDGGRRREWMAYGGCSSLPLASSVDHDHERDEG